MTHLRTAIWMGGVTMAAGCIVQGHVGDDRQSTDAALVPWEDAPDHVIPSPNGQPADTGSPTDTGDPDTGSDPTADLVVELTWTQSGDDLDLHLLQPGGMLETEGDCYFANCVDWGQGTLDWGETGYDGDDPVLDVDDISGTGPERIRIPDPAPGTYAVYVHDYPGSVLEPGVGATVIIRVRGRSPVSTSFQSPGEDHYVHVADVQMPDGAVTVHAGAP